MKSPNPPKEGCFGACVGRVCCGGGEVGASKKLPPPANDDVAGFGAAARGLFTPVSSPAKGDGFGGCCAGWEKLRLEKASFMPPNADCAGGDCGAPKEPDCDGWCWG